MSSYGPADEYLRKVRGPKKPGRTRQRLAVKLKESLREAGVECDVLAEELRPAEGYYRSNTHADCWRWDGSIHLRIEDGGSVRASVGCWDTMTKCVKNGMWLIDRDGMLFEVAAKEDNR